MLSIIVAAGSFFRRQMVKLPSDMGNALVPWRELRTDGLPRVSCAHSGTSFAMMPVAEDGAKPSPRPTNTREAHSASRLIFAAGGAIRVPSDHSPTPADSTFAPPSLRHAALCQAGHGLAIGRMAQKSTGGAGMPGTSTADRQSHLVEIQPAGICVTE
jgi:hypothetical protein